MIQNNSGVMVNAVKNGYSSQVATFIEVANGNAFFSPLRERLYRENAGAYAESSIQSSSVLSLGSVQPLMQPSPEQPDTCMETVCCCCCWKPIGRFLKKIAVYITMAIIFVWVIWLLNLYFTGSRDLRNLPVFRSFPSVERQPPAAPLFPQSESGNYYYYYGNPTPYNNNPKQRDL